MFSVLVKLMVFAMFLLYVASMRIRLFYLTANIIWIFYSEICVMLGNLLRSFMRAYEYMYLDPGILSQTIICLFTI